MTELKYTLLIHGGAGGKASDGAQRVVDKVVAHGGLLLKQGQTSLDVVTECVAILEDEPLLNAGRGSVLNRDGKVEMDAAVMDGRDLSSGAVACVTGVKNPIGLARLVMERSPHVFLAGTGAEEFAAFNEVSIESDDYFITEKRLADWQSAKTEAGKIGTVGAVARDREGNLAAATSTGGIAGKLPGRIGDSPMVGAGVYADNQSCAVSGTGSGEDFIRTVLCKTVADLVFRDRVDAQAAADGAIAGLVERINGRGGVIAVDFRGNPGVAWSTPALLYGVTGSN